MNGFFDKDQLHSGAYKSEKGVLSCASCGLYKTATTPKMKPFGEFKKGIMVIGEGPCEDDDLKGIPWQGKLGRVLQRKYKELGIDIFKDCISLHAVNCWPSDKKGNNRTPSDHEIACCRQKVLLAIQQYKPKVIILQGNSAISSIITGYRWKGNPSGISAWRGWTIPDREFGAWVCPTFHPSFIERQEQANEAVVIWTNDLRQAIAKADVPFPIYEDERRQVILYKSGTPALNTMLKNILREKPSLLAFDIETTGLKPYNKENHQIVSISFCYEDDKAHALLMPSEGKDFRLVKKILECPDIGKIAANMKHEDNWLSTLCGISTNPWNFDTMQAAHILDNRPGVTGLKFQSYIKFGLSGYEQEISPFLKSPDANTPNRISELTKDKDALNKLLTYNGIDSLVTFRLAAVQKIEMNF